MGQRTNNKSTQMKQTNTGKLGAVAYKVPWLRLAAGVMATREGCVKSGPTTPLGEGVEHVHEKYTLILTVILQSIGIPSVFVFIYCSSSREPHWKDGTYIHMYIYPYTFWSIVISYFLPYFYISVTIVKVFEAFFSIDQWISYMYLSLLNADNQKMCIWRYVADTGWPDCRCMNSMHSCIVELMNPPLTLL